MTLLYDGQCPICRRFALFVAVNRHTTLELKDARESPELVKRLKQEGLDPAEGVVVIDGPKRIQGEAAIVYLESFVHPRSLWARVIRWSMARPRLLTIVYPFLKGLRKLLLRCKGIPPEI